jgi:hypothetical protein
MWPISPPTPRHRAAAVVHDPTADGAHRDQEQVVDVESAP